MPWFQSSSLYSWLAFLLDYEYLLLNVMFVAHKILSLWIFPQIYSFQNHFQLIEWELKYSYNLGEQTVKKALK